MTNVTTMTDAISDGVSDGDQVYLAGFTHLIPFAAGHEMIRQELRDLDLVRATPDLIYDQLIAAGCASKVNSCLCRCRRLRALLCATTGGA